MVSVGVWGQGEKSIIQPSTFNSMQLRTWQNEQAEDQRVISTLAVVKLDWIILHVPSTISALGNGTESTGFFIKLQEIQPELLPFCFMSALGTYWTRTY